MKNHLLAFGLLAAGVALRANGPARLLAAPLDIELADERYAILAEGIPGELAERLAWRGAWLVEPARWENALEQAGVDAPDALSLASQRELARRAGAAWLLSGAAGGDADGVRVSLRLVAVHGAQMPMRIEEKFAWTDLPGFLDRAEVALAGALAIPGREAPVLGPGAIELYLRARAEASPVTRLGLLQTCLSGSPGFARARARLTEALLDNQKIPEASVAFAPIAQRLGKPDDPLPAGGAGVELALLKARLDYQAGDSVSADAWTRRALAAEPSAAGYYLLARIRNGLRDRANAMIALDNALALEPGHPGATRLKEKLLAAAPASAPASVPGSAPATVITAPPPPVISPAPAQPSPSATSPR